jgi:hypothetical protein
MSRDDDLPEMPESKTDRRRRLDHARARAIQQFSKTTLWDAVDSEMVEVLVDLKMLREFGDDGDRKFALRELVQLWVRMPPRPALPPEKGITQEEFTARMDAAEQDAAVRAYLKRKGWTEPTTKGAGN